MNVWWRMQPVKSDLHVHLQVLWGSLYWQNACTSQKMVWQACHGLPKWVWYCCQYHSLCWKPLTNTPYAWQQWTMIGTTPIEEGRPHSFSSSSCCYYHYAFTITTILWCPSSSTWISRWIVSTDVGANPVSIMAHGIANNGVQALVFTWVVLYWFINWEQERRITRGGELYREIIDMQKVPL